MAGTTVKELVPNYMDLLDQGLSHDEIKGIAKARLTSAPSTQESQKEDTSLLDKTKQLSQDTMTNPSFGAQVAKGLANSFIKTAEVADAIKVPNVFSALGKMVLPEDKQSLAEAPKMPQRLIDLGESLDEQKQKTSERFISPDRKVERDALNEENRNAKGVMQNAKVGIKQMWDSATHPKEWTVQGVTEFATDPTNALSLGLGNAMAKGVASPVLKFLAGSAAGGSENAIIGAGTAYARARAEGKSEEEAQNIAIQSAAGGALVGSALGGAGGLASHVKPNETPKNTLKDAQSNEPKITDTMDSAFNTLGETPKTEQSTSQEPSYPAVVKPVFDLVEAELKAHNDHIATQKFTDDMIQQGMIDPVMLRQAIEQNISPTPTDMQITQLLNDGNALPPSMSGARLAVKLNNTIEVGEQTPEAVYAKLKSAGASDELASKAAEAVQHKNPDIFYAWYTKKLEPMYKPNDTIDANALPERSLTQQSSINDAPLPPNKDILPHENTALTHESAPSDTMPSSNMLHDQSGESVAQKESLLSVLYPDETKKINTALLLDKAEELAPKSDVLSLVKYSKNGIASEDLGMFVKVDTLLNHLAEKGDEGSKRLEFSNYIAPTIQRPLLILHTDDKYTFVKPFKYEHFGEEKLRRYMVVTADKNGELKGVTSYPLENTDLKNLIVKSDEVISGGNYPDFLPPRLESGASNDILPQKHFDDTISMHEPLDGIENDITYKQAYEAHLGTSLDPEKRANNRINGYIESLKSDYDSLKPLVTDGEKLAQLNLRFSEYRETSKALYSDLLAKESRVMSPMVTGPARFPVEANQKRIASADKAREAFLDYQDRALKKMRAMLDPQESNVIRSNDVDAIAKLQSKLENQQKNHAMMKETNVILRSKDDVAIKEARLKELGYGDEAVASFLKEGGFASYAFANSTQRMKQTQGRLLELQRLEKAEKEGKVSTLLYEGAKVEENLQAKRVQIRFDEIPSAETRAELKKRGFKWSPKEEAWQRILTPDAKLTAQEIIDRHYTRAFDGVTKKMLEC